MSQAWEPVNRKGKALFDFAPPPDGEFQLPLKKGQEVSVFSKRSGWYKGFVHVDGEEKRGIFPESYVSLTEESLPAGNDKLNESTTKAKESQVKSDMGTSSGNKWKPVNKLGEALYEFDGSGKFQLALEKGGKVVVLAESRGWYKGYVQADESKAQGFFPVAYIRLTDEPLAVEEGTQATTLQPLSQRSAISSPRVKPPPPRKAKKDSIMSETITVSDIKEDNMTMQALLKEIELCMSLWLEEANDKLVEGHVTDYQRVQERITTLLELRGQLLEIPAEDMKMDFPPLRKHIIHLIEKSRKMVVGFMVPRNSKGMLADTSNTSIMELMRLHDEMYRPGEDAGHLSFSERQVHRRSTISAMRMLSKNMHSVSEMINQALGRKPEIDLFQLVVECSMVITTIREEFHLTFSLWNKTTKAPMTDEWSLTFSELGMAKNVLNTKTIFSDLTMADLEQDLYLVCKVYRNGNLLFEKAATQVQAGKPKDEPKYRRPFFISMARLTDVGLNKFVEKDCTPGREFSIRAPSNELKFSELPKSILEGKTAETKAVMEAKQVIVTINLRNATLKATQERNEGELEGRVVTRKLFFPKVFNPAETRNDFFVWLDTGKFLQGSKKAALNVQVVVTVWLDDGKQVQKAIQGSGNPDPQDSYVSSVYYHCNSPPWGEILSLKISPEDLERAHLQFVVYHASTNKKNGTPLSFGWLKLTSERGAVIPDKKYTISTYKISSNLKELKGCKYLHIGADKNLKVRKGEEIQVSTKLLSTLKTQNDVLHSLFKWKTINVPQLEHYLKLFVKTPYSSEETRRYMKEMLEMLFSMLESKSHEMNQKSKLVHPKVLSALLHILSNLKKEEKEMLQTYIKDVFKFSSVHVILLDLVQKLMKEQLQEVGELLVPMCKSYHWLMHICVRSYELDTTNSVPLSTLKESLRNTLAPVSKLLKRDIDEKKAITRGQDCLVKILPSLLQSFEKIYSGEELAEIVVWLVKSIHPNPANDVPRLNLLRVLTEQIAFRSSAQGTFFPLLLEMLQKYILPRSNGVDECYLSINILRKLLEFIETTSGVEGEAHVDAKEASRDIRSAQEASQLAMKFIELLPEVTYTAVLLLRAKVESTLLPPPSLGVKSLCKGTRHLDSDTLICVITFFKLLPEDKLLEFIGGIDDSDKFKFLQRLLELWTLALRLNVYSEVWVTIITLQVQVACKVHAMLSDLLCSVAKQPEELGVRKEQVIASYFILGLELLQHHDLATESMNGKRRRLVERMLGTDLRPRIRKSIVALWGALGDRSQAYIRSLIPGMFSILQQKLDDSDQGLKPPEAKTSGRMSSTIESRIKDVESQKMCMDIYYSMIVTEWRVTKHINKVERYTIDVLSEIIHDSQGRGEMFYQMLNTELKERFSKDVENQKQPGDIFLNHIGHLFNLMSSLLKFPTTAIYEDERTSMALALMDYLKQPDESGQIRREMYFRYVNYLVDLHAELKNYEEAGITQLLEVDMLEWSDNVVDARGDLPRETERERKERLYQNANSFFTAGQNWERAIEMCEKLGDYYRHDQCDYERLASVLKQEAELFSKIASSPRFYPSYYMVVFRGDFADEKDGSEYVYRGGKMEKVMNFSQRIKRKYPNAKLVMRSEPKEKELEENKQIICIVTLKLPPWAKVVEKGLASEAEKKKTESYMSNPRVTEPVMEYFENSTRSVFLYEKPEQKGGKKPENEFKDLWIRETYLKTESSFPTVHRRCKVVSRNDFMLTPIENAANMIASKNRQILKEIAKVQREAEQLDVGPLISPTLKSPTRTQRQSTFGFAVSSSALNLSNPTVSLSKARRGSFLNIGGGSSRKDTTEAKKPQLQVNTLSSLLQGTIDAAVNGGTKLFCEAFLIPSYRAEHSSKVDVQRIRHLRKMLNEQIEVLRQGLNFYGQVCPQAYRPLLEHLNTTYAKMIDSLKQYAM